MRRGEVAGTIAAGAAAYAALLARPAGPAALVVSAVVGTFGALAPVPTRTAAPAGWVRWAAVTLAGTAAFAAGRALAPHPVPHLAAWSAFTVAPPLVASVAEEAFFRRWLYGWAAAWGPGAAVVGTAAAFALVHLPAYGPQALPVDFAAGLVFGWQRLATGGWTASAATHAAANALQML